MTVFIVIVIILVIIGLVIRDFVPQVPKKPVYQKSGNIIETKESFIWTYESYFNSIKHGIEKNIEFHFKNHDNESIKIILLFDETNSYDLTSYIHKEQNGYNLLFHYFTDTYKEKLNPILDSTLDMDKRMSVSIIDNTNFQIFSLSDFSIEIKLESNLVHLFYNFESGLFLKIDFFIFINHLLYNYIFEQKWNDLVVDNALTPLPKKYSKNMRLLLRNAKQKYVLLLKLQKSIPAMRFYIEKEIHNSKLENVFLIFQESIYDELNDFQCNSIITCLDDKPILTKFLTLFDNWDFNVFISHFVLYQIQLEPKLKPDLLLSLIQNKDLDLSAQALNILINEAEINFCQEIGSWLISLLKIRTINLSQFDLKNLARVLISHDIVEAIQPLITVKKDFPGYNDVIKKRLTKDRIQLIDETIQQLKANKSGYLSIAEYHQTGGLSVTNDDE